MIRPLTLCAALCLSGAAQAEGLDLSPSDRLAFGQEVRAAILADPSPIEHALTPPPPDLYAEAVAADKQRLEENAALFAPTPRGFGAEDPRVTIVFYESYPCAECATAWADLELLLAHHPDLRVEPRFAEESAAAQLLLSLLDREGAERYREVRATLMAATTEAELADLMAKGGWIQDRMLRPAPRQDAAAFTALELDSTPSYVLPGMMLQGAMPAIVLEKYLAE